MSSEDKVTVTEEKVILKRKGQSHSVVAEIIGVDTVSNKRFIHLDRMIHKRFEEFLAHYKVRGVLNSVLIEDLKPAQQQQA